MLSNMLLHTVGVHSATPLFIVPYCMLKLTFPTLCLPAALKTVLEVPLGSRFLRLNAKGPDMIGERLQFSQYSEYI